MQTNKQRTPGNVMLEPRLALKGIKRFRRGLICTGIKGGVSSGQDSTQLIFQLVRGKNLMFSSKATTNQRCFKCDDSWEPMSWKCAFLAGYLMTINQEVFSFYESRKERCQHLSSQFNSLLQGLTFD